MQTITVELPQTIKDYISERLDNASPLRMEGWCTPEKAESLAGHVIERKPKMAIEIGVYAGRSLFAVALAMKEVGVGTILGIDPWSPVASIAGFESDPANRDWWSNLDHNSIYKQCVAVQNTLALLNIHLYRGTASQALPLIKWAFPSPVVDLLHIDGNHSEKSALSDVEGYVPMVRPGGYVYFDDCDWETTKRAQKRLSEFCRFSHMVGNCGVYVKQGVLDMAIAQHPIEGVDIGFPKA